MLDKLGRKMKIQQVFRNLSYNELWNCANVKGIIVGTIAKLFKLNIYSPIFDHTLKFDKTSVDNIDPETRKGSGLSISQIN